MAAPKTQDVEQGRIEPAVLIGRDEMNLAEFPITLVADYAPRGQKTLYFEDAHGRLTVTGSDAYGLPTALDADVIVALIYLTKLRNDFKDVKVNFSRYELIRLLKWPDKGSSYGRLDQALNRWGGVWLVYDKCWWNNRLKRHVSAKMHILESVVITEPGKASGWQSHIPMSTFTWNKTFIESCQADNLRQLDLDTYFSLQSAISKRLYRFLGKRFYLQAEWEFGLSEVAFDRVGLSRNYEGNAGKIKEKLQPALDELEAIGFLRPRSRDERYSRIDRGAWTIRLARQSPALPLPPPPAVPSFDPEPPLVADLVSRGVTRTVAVDLVQQYPAEAIEAKREVFDWLIKKQDRRVAKSPAGYLVKSIQDDYAVPKGFLSEAERLKREDAKQTADRKAVEDRRRQREEEQRQERERKAVDAYLENLTPAEREALKAEVLAQADPESRQAYEDPMLKMFRETLMRDMLRKYLMEKDRRGE
jgi:hypothetical protein